jgi:membrane protein implicated in regulation of membrane protease activity
MLFFFRGRYGPIARAVVGAVFVVLGIVLHGEIVLAAFGAVLLVWAGYGALRYRRSSQQADSNGPMS